MGFHLQDDAAMGEKSWQHMEIRNWHGYYQCQGQLFGAEIHPYPPCLSSNMCIVETSEKPPLYKHGRSLVLSPPIPGECLRGTIPEIEA